MGERISKALQSIHHKLDVIEQYLKAGRKDIAFLECSGLVNLCIALLLALQEGMHEK